MRDKRKFCRPKTTGNPQVGDVEVKLKCGHTVYIKTKDYNNIKKFFKINSIVGESTNSPGNLKVLSKDLNEELFIDSLDYINNLDKFELIGIVGEKAPIPFGQHEYVDLGLPSGTLWATMNVGAASEHTLGNYYKFGETTVYDGTDYNTSTYTELKDLDLAHDAANVNWSGGWHIPTRAQWEELIDNTTHTWISDYQSSGISVMKFIKLNDSSTFILIPVGGSYTDGELNNPNTGYYWTNSQHYGSASYAVITENSYLHVSWRTAYGHGFLVRPVCDSVEGQQLAQKGDIICHNNELNYDAIFSYSNWLTLGDSWDAIGIYGINTIEEEDAVGGEYVILANGTTFIINSSDYSDVSSQWEHVDTIEETRVVAKFNVTSTSSPIQLCNNNSVSQFSAIEIDGVAQPSVVSAYTFTTTGEHTVKYTLTDPTNIGIYAFRNCSSLTSIDIPSGVTSIGDSAFYQCSSLTSITIPNSVTSISDGAFYNCSSLTSCTIGNSVTSIGEYAFYGCSGLTSIDIPDSVTSIGIAAFMRCSGLTSVISNATTAPTITSSTFRDVNTGGTLTVPSGSTGYDTWMGTGNYYLGSYNWTKVEQ